MFQGDGDESGAEEGSRPVGRRAALAAAGTAVAGLSGCLGGGWLRAPTRADPGDRDADDGYPPPREDPPPARSFDPGQFRTLDVEGTEVELAGVEVVANWHARRAARFVDARGKYQFRRSHVLGAVVSPPGGPIAERRTDPVTDWPEGDRVVCYCGCPHHLSSLKAAELRGAGFDSVYVLDEGLWEWQDRGLPMAGTEVAATPSAVVVRGEVDPAHAGEFARTVHPPTGQREAAPIDDRGGFALHVRFSDVTAATPLELRTPAFTVTAPLGDLAAGVVTGPPETTDR